MPDDVKINKLGGLARFELTSISFICNFCLFVRYFKIFDSVFCESNKNVVLLI